MQCEVDFTEYSVEPHDVDIAFDEQTVCHLNILQIWCVAKLHVKYYLVGGLT